MIIQDIIIWNIWAILLKITKCNKKNLSLIVFRSKFKLPGGPMLPKIKEYPKRMCIILFLIEIVLLIAFFKTMFKSDSYEITNFNNMLLMLIEGSS